MSETVRIVASWESGPYGVYYRAPENRTGQEVYDIDIAVMARYESAEKEFWAAEDALKAAIEVAKLAG